MKTVFVLVAIFLVGAMILQDVEAGFGCPGNQYRCHRHCKSIGCRAGYCDAATLWLRCTCRGCRDRTTTTSP